jgi:hypothetical protein
MTYTSTTCENQIISNTGQIFSKFYTTIELDDGYYTSVPVINCQLPTITYQTSGGARTLILDYSRGFAYQNSAKPVKYSFTQERAPTRAPNGIAPAPKLPTDPTSPRKVPLIEPTTPSGPTGPAPGLSTPTDKQIEDLLNRVQKLEKVTAPTGPTPRITVENNKAESMTIPSAPTIPKDISPYPDNITKPTYD